MTTVDHAEQPTISERPSMSAIDKWLVLLAMLVYAAGVSIYAALSIGLVISEHSRTHTPGDAFDQLVAGITFFWIVAYAVGFALLTVVLDVLTARRAQPFNALNLALGALATFELFRFPLTMAAWSILFALVPRPV